MEKNYWLSPKAKIALELLQNGSRARALLIEGPPGTGKTSLGRYFASLKEAEIVYYLCHHWTSDEDLFLWIDVGRVALGPAAMASPQDAYRPGVLLRAVEASWNGPVVLIIDELDKAPERVDALLLEFLQTYTIWGPNGEKWTAKADNLYVFITSNGVREISDPLRRRCFRLYLSWLPYEVELSLLEQAGVPKGLARTLLRAASILRAAYDDEFEGGYAVSIQELTEAGKALVKHAQGPEDVEAILRGFIASSDESWELLQGGYIEKGLRGFGKEPQSVFWGVLKEARNG